MSGIVGLDIGGANLKAAHEDGDCRSVAFPLWREPERLTAALRELTAGLPEADRFAVTMTGELADCFVTKAEGVARILAAVEELAAGRGVRVWQTGGEFVTPETAREFPLLAAAANWHALATWLGSLVPQGVALLIDIGSTTTDVIPLEDGYPVPAGVTDVGRLESGELEYSGVSRTPLCVIAHSAPLRSGRIALAAELFATTRDLYLWRGEVAEEPEDCDTANGRPATRAEARHRLCRMLCADATEVDGEELDALCAFLVDVQATRIAGCVDRVLGRQSGGCENVLISGAGAFLAERIAGGHPRLQAATQWRLAEMFSPEAAEAACALAVARLAGDRI